MSVTSFAINDLFYIRVRKHHNEDPSTVWYNTYEVAALSSGGLDEIQGAKTICVNFEAALLLNSATIDQATVSTWEPGLGGYNPGDFITYIENTVGTRALTGGDDLDLTVAFYIRRQAESGRNGKIFLRNSLLSTDVVSTGGKWRFASAGAMSTLVQDAIDTSSMDLLMEGAGAFQLSMIEESGDHRPVLDLLPDRVSNVKLNHVYFDVGEEAGPALALAAQKQGINLTAGQRIRVVRKRGAKSPKSA